jgi:hypothetical protein
MPLRFESSGQQWDDHVEAMVKGVVGDAVVAHPKDALVSVAEPVLGALVTVLDRKLTAARV